MITDYCYKTAKKRAKETIKEQDALQWGVLIGQRHFFAHLK
jgi:hypothetical protein